MPDRRAAMSVQPTRGEGVGQGRRGCCRPRAPSPLRPSRSAPVASESDETGRWDAHVMEIETGRRWIVSTVQGYLPNWTVDGSRILYMAEASTVYTVEVRPALGRFRGRI